MADDSLLPIVGQEVFDVIPPGSPLDSYMQWACRQHGASPVYHLVCALSVAAHELARHGFSLGTGTPLSIWFALVGESSLGKSSAIDMVYDFVHDVWEQAEIVVDPDPWVETNGSVAGILSAVQEHFHPDRGTTACMLYKHELSSVFNTREAIPEFLCDLSDGRTIQRNLRELQQKVNTGKKKPKDRLDRVYFPVTSGLFATTLPALAEVFTEAMRYGGLFSRLWWVKPPFDPALLRLQAHNYATEREKAVHDWVGWIVSYTIHEKRAISFAPEAWEMLNKELFEPNAAKCVADDWLNGTRIRIVSKAQVLSAIFAVMSGRTIVQKQDMQHSIALAKMLLVYALEMSDLGAPDLVRAGAKAERYIIGCGEQGAQKRELYRHLHRDKRTIDLVVEMLLDMGAIEEDKAERVPRYIAASTERAKKITEGRLARTYDFAQGNGGGNVFDMTVRRR